MRSGLFCAALAALSAAPALAAVATRVAPPVEAALRAALSAPAAAAELARTPGLAVLASGAPASLSALTPLLSRLPADFAALPAPAAVRAAAAEPAVMRELDARARELATLGDAEEAAQAWSGLAGEAAALAFYGPEAAGRAARIADTAAVAKASARARRVAEAHARALSERAADDLEAAALDSRRWSGYAEAIASARSSVHAVNVADPKVPALLADARLSGYHAVTRRVPSVPHPFLVVDNRVRFDFDHAGRLMRRVRASRGWLLADGSFLPRGAAATAASSAQAFLDELPEEARHRAEADLFTGVQAPTAVAALLIFFAAALALLSFPAVLVLPLGAWSLHAVLRGYAGRRRKALVAAAARLGWTPEETAAARGGAPEWERLLGDLSWSPDHPYHRRLDAAAASLKDARLSADDLRRLLDRLKTPVWTPYLRSEHLGLVWRHLDAADPIASALAAGFLAGANRHFLASFLAENPVEASRLEVFARFAPDAARALRGETAGAR